jgi:hypothetical protein
VPSDLDTFSQNCLSSPAFIGEVAGDAGGASVAALRAFFLGAPFDGDCGAAAGAGTGSEKERKKFLLAPDERMKILAEHS